MQVRISRKHDMREFFRGWRRKLGVATLVMACVFAAGWVRSLFHRDNINLSRTAWVVSKNGQLAYWHIVAVPEEEEHWGPPKREVLWRIDYRYSTVLFTVASAFL